MLTSQFNMICVKYDIIIILIKLSQIHKIDFTEDNKLTSSNLPTLILVVKGEECLNRDENINIFKLKNCIF